MPAQITPIDVTSYASSDIYRLGEKIFENELVKHRFQTDYGLRAIVRSKGVFHIEMIVDNEQLFGRCNCLAGSSPCEHKVAALLAWLNEPTSFISYQHLRKTIKNVDKNSLVELVLNLTELFPEMCHFFDHKEGTEEVDYIRENVADIFDFPHTEKIDPAEIIGPSKILLVRTRFLRHENKWRQARIVMFELLNRILSLVDQSQLTQSFHESFVADIVDDYIDIALTDPDAEMYVREIKQELIELLRHSSSEEYGIIMEPLKQKFDIK